MERERQKRELTGKADIPPPPTLKGLPPPLSEKDPLLDLDSMS